MRGWGGFFRGVCCRRPRLATLAVATFVMALALGSYAGATAAPRVRRSRARDAERSGARSSNWLGSGRRRAGLLLHVSSFPGSFGIGGLGPAAHRLIDQVAEMGFSYLQVLPLGPTGYGDSPFQPQSMYAGNPYFVSLERLHQRGLITDAELNQARRPSGPVNYGDLWQTRGDLLRTAAKRDSGLFEKRNDPSWLRDWSLFAAIRRDQGWRSWRDWAPALRDRDPRALHEAEGCLAEEVAVQTFIQREFSDQWASLRDHAHRRGIELVGNLPIYVADDSVERWAHPELFKTGVVAGVPPDYFSSDGQRWGNPIYRWEDRRERVFAWWGERMVNTLRMVDAAQIDHFRGFTSYWEVPEDSPTAVAGRWRRGPASDGFFEHIAHELAAVGLEPKVIAENLGVITNAVQHERRRHGFPGVLVTLFGVRSPNQHHAPLSRFNFDHVRYSGTHDNLATVERLEAMTPFERDRAAFVAGSFLRARGFELPDELYRAIDLAGLASKAPLMMLRPEDMRGMGREGTMNRPGIEEGNWASRMGDPFSPQEISYWREQIERTSRLPPAP